MKSLKLLKNVFISHKKMFSNRRPFQANRDAGIREAECEKAAMDVKYSTGAQLKYGSISSEHWNHRTQIIPLHLLLIQLWHS